METDGFSDRLRRLMESRGLSQAALIQQAADAGYVLGRSQVSQYVSGKVVPRREALEALAAALGSRVVPARLLLFGVFCAVLPDLDVIGFKLGIRYADLLGHRGFSHSLLFALLMGLFGAALAPWLRCSRPAAFGVGLAAVASHILLDAMTNGGLGVAALWPLDKARYFLDWRPIRVSPLNLRVFFGRQGLEVLISEWRWVWLPCVTAGATAWLLRRALTNVRRKLRY